MGDEETKEAQVTEDQPDEGFGDAFSEAVAGEAASTEEKKEEESTDDKAEVKGEEGEKGEEEATPPPKPGKSEEKVETPESLEQKYKTLQGMYNQLKEEKEKAPAPEEKAPPPPDFSALFENLDADLSDEIKSELADYEEEFDHISRFEGLKREQLAKRLIALMEASFQKFGEQLKPLYKTVGETAQSTHYATLKGKHEDFEEIRDSGALKEWIESKPKIVQRALNDVYKNGDTQDVIELFDTFKQETNYKKTASAPPAKGKEKPSERGLEIVRTKERGIPPSQPQGKQAKEDDFSAAFNEAASK